MQGWPVGTIVARLLLDAWRSSTPLAGQLAVR
jgi:hypothetical protein